MPKFSANLTFLFQELPFLDRIDASAQAGFKGVEHQFPYDMPPSDIMQRIQDHDLSMVLINAPAGDWQAGERGLASRAGRNDEFKKSIETAIEYAKALKCPRVHVMSGLLDTDVDKESAMVVLAENLNWAATEMEREGVKLLLEALNPVDVPGYILGHSGQTRAVMSLINHPNIRMQYDLYHGAMNGENLQESVSMHFEVIEHMQVAGAPGRHEPDTGDTEFNSVFEMVDMLGYPGWIGCEYAPKTTTRAGLEWGSVYGLKAV